MTEADFLTSTRASYDAFADDYAAWLRTELESKPLERGLLAGFAEYVRSAGAGPVADIGCGTGRVTAHLHGLGVDVFGIDLSPGMLAAARREHPALRFEEGSMLSLDLPDGGLGGVLAWYSTIHVPGERLPEAFAEFRRVLAPGGEVLLGFQVGDESLRLEEAFGHTVALDFNRWQPDRIAELLTEAGLTVRAKMWRDRDTDSEYPERTPQAFVLARKPAGGGQSG
ncbi:class I SAM-dependent methyltransferase [Streptomyces sp. NPDC050610]|uniref:class I SAM-dependent DNA methyltransferase n=1 Tax=Streptomyces sp. NPDC050610 TaxID=3157097 RepID=UPI003433A8FC